MSLRSNVDLIKNTPPFKGLSIRIPFIIPIKGRGVINHGSTLHPNGLRA